MGVGPQQTPNERDDAGANTLFDRIAREIADTAAAFPGDETAEVARPASAVTAVIADDSAPGGIVLSGSAAWPAPDISTQMERPSIAERQCSRTGCSEAAAVTLSYHYGQSQVWIDHLSPEREPHMYDMCARHAAALSVPRGWHLDDRRGARRGALIAV